MYNYLGPKTADYTAEILQIKSQVIIPETGNKSQVVHGFDDGSVSVVGLSSSSFFDVQLQWPRILPADKIMIMDLWHNPAKADGLRRSFYWAHPTDKHIYTVKFTSPLVVERRPVTMGIQTLSLRVEGNKPV